MLCACCQSECLPSAGLVTITHFIPSLVPCLSLLILVYGWAFLCTLSLFLRGGGAVYAGQAEFADGVAAVHGGALRALGWLKKLKQQSVHWEQNKKSWLSEVVEPFQNIKSHAIILGFPPTPPTLHTFLPDLRIGMWDVMWPLAFFYTCQASSTW